MSICALYIFSHIIENLLTFYCRNSTGHVCTISIPHSMSFICAIFNVSTFFIGRSGITMSPNEIVFFLVSPKTVRFTPPSL